MVNSQLKYDLISVTICLNSTNVSMYRLDLASPVRGDVDELAGSAEPPTGGARDVTRGQWRALVYVWLSRPCLCLALALVYVWLSPPCVCLASGPLCMSGSRALVYVWLSRPCVCLALAPLCLSGSHALVYVWLARPCVCLASGPMCMSG